MKEETAVEVQHPTNMLAVIAQAAVDPRCDITKMERLLAMQQTIMKDQREAAFAGAMSRLQAKLPQIQKSGAIIVKGTERSRYAKIEDIDVAIRPLLAEEGFSFSFDSDSSDGKLFKLSAKLSHREGHSETKHLVLPIDSSDYRSNVQSIGSTVSYGKRQLIKMHLNLIECGEDDDGAGGAKPISPAQAAAIATSLVEVGFDQGRFLKFMGVAEVADILARDYQKAQSAIEEKRRTATGAEPITTIEKKRAKILTARDKLGDVVFLRVLGNHGATAIGEVTTIAQADAIIQQLKETLEAKAAKAAKEAR
jgi:hypothetical protein